jgi:hypothetical protein
VVVAEALVVAVLLPARAQRAHVVQLLQPALHPVWLLTLSVFRLALRQHPQPQAAEVVDAVVPVAEVVQDGVVAVLHKVALQLRLQAACWAQPRRMQDAAAVAALRPRLSLAFRSSDRRPMEIFWSRGIRSPRKKHGVGQPILRLGITRAER